MGQFQKIESARKVPPAYGGPGGSGCWDNINQQWAPWELCNGIGGALSDQAAEYIRTTRKKRSKTSAIFRNATGGVLEDPKNAQAITYVAAPAAGAAVAIMIYRKFIQKDKSKRTMVKNIIAGGIGAIVAGSIAYGVLKNKLVAPTPVAETPAAE